GTRCRPPGAGRRRQARQPGQDRQRPGPRPGAVLLHGRRPHRPWRHGLFGLRRRTGQRPPLGTAARALGDALGRRRRRGARALRPVAGGAGPRRRRAGAVPAGRRVSQPRWLPVTLLALAALTSGWLVYRLRQADTAPVLMGPPRSDYTLQDFSLVALDAQGHEAFSVRGPRLARHPHLGTLDISEPRLRFPDAHGGIWTTR